MEAEAQQPEIRIFSDLQKSVVKITARSETSISEGTGIIVSKEPFIVTNLHVILSASSVVASMNGSDTEWPLRVRAIKPEWDLVVLEVANGQDKPQGFQQISFAENTPAPGSDVFAVGFPLGLGYTVNKGILSGIRTYGKLPAEYRGYRKLDLASQWIQTDCPINPGNSGGPLLDSTGHLIGVNTWGSRVDNDVFFALSAEHVKSLILEARDHPLKIKNNGNEINDIGLPSTASTALVQLDGPDKDGMGYLQLSAPPECNISIDCRVVGTSPAEGGGVVIGNLSIGNSYILSVDRKGWFPFYAAITIPENGVAVQQVSLQRATSQLIVSSIPLDAIVTIEGPVGGTQVKKEASVTFDGILPGEYLVTLSGNNQRLTTNIHISEASTVFIMANLINGDISVRDTTKPLRADRPIPTDILKDNEQISATLVFTKSNRLFHNWILVDADLDKPLGISLQQKNMFLAWLFLDINFRFLYKEHLPDPSQINHKLIKARIDFKSSMNVSIFKEFEQLNSSMKWHE